MKKIITTTLVSLTIAAAAAIPAFAVEKIFADDTIVISGEITNGDEGSIMMVDGNTGCVTKLASEDDSTNDNIIISADSNVPEGQALIVDSANGSIIQCIED